MDEACAAQLPSACRQLFVFILLECTPSEPRMMYDKHHEDMRMDYKHKRMHHDGYSPDEAQQFAENDLLCYMDKCLRDRNKSNTDFNIPEGDFRLQQDLEVMINERDPNAEQYFESQIATITNEQRAVLDTILQNIDNHTGGFYFIDAPCRSRENIYPESIFSLCETTEQNSYWNSCFRHCRHPTTKRNYNT